MSLVFPDSNKVFFTSDTHFGHPKIIEYCKRPFDSIEDMDECLIQNWNSKVSPADTVFHLGDFAFGGASFWASTISKLNGNIHLIIGNHDIRNLKEGFIKLFKTVAFQQTIKIDNKSVILNHYPFLCYSGDHEGVYQLFGHIHSGPNSTSRDVAKMYILEKNQYDVGVDNNNYAPMSFAEIVATINSNKE